MHEGESGDRRTSDSRREIGDEVDLRKQERERGVCLQKEHQ
jgi:hypothetical protein